MPTDLVVRLLDIERDAHGLKRRHGVHTRIEELFRQEWRDLESLVSARRAGRGEVEESEEELESEIEPELPLTDGPSRRVVP